MQAVDMIGTATLLVLPSTYGQREGIMSNVSVAESQLVKDVLTVIPCLNEEQYLAELVQALLAEGHELPIRIVIADGGSSDRTQNIAEALARRYPNVLFLHNPKKLQAAAVNLAVALHCDDLKYLIRIDAHAQYPNDYCRTLVAEAEETGAASVVVAINAVGATGFQKAVAAAQNSLLGNGGSAHRMVSNGKWIDHGHHALMRIDAFRAVGGYDESFSHNEDAELDTRLCKAGYKIWLTGKTAVIYYPRAAPWPLFRQYLYFGNGRARNILKHRTLPKLRQLAPAAVLPAVFLALFAPLWLTAILPLAAWILLCVVYGIVLSLRNPGIATASPGFAAMIMHLGWSLGFWKAMLTSVWKDSGAKWAALTPRDTSTISEHDRSASPSGSGEILL
jgi:succinoglycan biosynthesis protein ExoA